MNFVTRIVRQAREAWVGSLRLRMVMVSGGLSLVAAAVIGGFLSFTIERNLFESRRNEIISETQSVSGSVQAQFDGAIDAQGFIDVESATPRRKRQFGQQQTHRDLSVLPFCEPPVK